MVSVSSEDFPCDGTIIQLLDVEETAWVQPQEIRGSLHFVISAYAIGLWFHCMVSTSAVTGPPGVLTKDV